MDAREGRGGETSGRYIDTLWKHWSQAGAVHAELVRAAAARPPNGPPYRLSGRRLGRRSLLSNAGRGGCEVLGRLLTYHA